MDMVLHTANQQRFEPVLARDAAQISPDTLLDVSAKKRLTAFGAEDHVIVKVFAIVLFGLLGYF